MVVSPCGKKSRRVSQPLNDVETEHAMIKTDGPLQIGNLQMHVSDANTGVNGHSSN